jgi:hypothetical protein
MAIPQAKVFAGSEAYILSPADSSECRWFRLYRFEFWLKCRRFLHGGISALDKHGQTSWHRTKT